MPPIDKSTASIEAYVKNLLATNKIVVFSKTTCPFCKKVKALFKELNETPLINEIDEMETGEQIKQYLIGQTKQATVPNVFINGEHVGGFDTVSKLNTEGRLAKMLSAGRSDAVVGSYLQPKASETTAEFVANLVETKPVVIFSKTSCPYSTKVKEMLTSLKREFTAVELDKIASGSSIRDHLYARTGQKTVPNVYVKGTHLGGHDNVFQAKESGLLGKLFESKAKDEDKTEYDYDLVVIGGGSGGLACSKRAADLGQKVACLDFVKPSPPGTTWGLGGTCVNVGCIPKKLMHQAAILGENMHHDAKEFGWTAPEKPQHSWETLVTNIQNHIGSLNFSYRVALRDKKVDYHNAAGKLLDAHRVHETYKNGKTKEITAKKIVVAVGGRPKYPETLKGGLEHCITSDDLFSLKYDPGKTLCVGASYVSLECAGFLKALGKDVTVMVRSILLRGFDQQMATIIGDYMETQASMRFLQKSTPVEITRVKEAASETEAPELLVKYKNGDGEIVEETFNTVVLAVGRDPCTSDLGLDTAGVKLAKNGKIITTFEQSSVDNIYAVGDVIEETTANGRVLELTPVAIQQGRLLAQRLYGKSDVKMDYQSVPTTVFTPIEYGAIGYSEEEAEEAFGAENLEVFHQKFWPLEWTVAHKPHDVCYVKLICNKKDNERVVGLHIAGPNAGEITQGYAVAMKLRATKQDFDMTVGIHPTCSETLTTLAITKNSGKDAAGSGC
jgi:glutaredoxin